MLMERSRERQFEFPRPDGVALFRAKAGFKSIKRHQSHAMYDLHQVNFRSELIDVRISMMISQGHPLQPWVVPKFEFNADQPI